jgi:hypothetical protein
MNKQPSKPSPTVFSDTHLTLVPPAGGPSSSWTATKPRPPSSNPSAAEGIALGAVLSIPLWVLIWVLARAVARAL